MGEWLIPALCLPLVGFLILVTFSRSIGRVQTGLIACSTVFTSFALFLFLLYRYQGPESITLFQWLPIPSMNVDFTLYLDALSLLMTLVITGVGFLIHVYANGYMDHEEDYPRFFALLNFFIFSMLLLVLGGHLLVLFIGWEGVGLASYLLIGYWYTRKSAAEAATKAFVMNRIGDLGLLLGILLSLYIFKTGDMATISQQVSASTPYLTVLTLLYFVGATGKSAQLPLHTWLPDAMEGPTPVSALIHAATMVTAGVYLVVRMHAVFSLAPDTLYVVGIVGAVTSLFASFSAFGQTDLKRVLAYSTVSQLGLMFLACGVGAYYAAMFHFATHAFIKALLFLSAGNVVHMMHGTTEMEKMGGLVKPFKITHGLFLIGSLALAGVPPLAAFFSKDMILEQTHLMGFYALFDIALISSILTGVYLIRAYCLAFLGTLQKENEAVHEAPFLMLAPLFILALLSIGGGAFGYTLAPFLEAVGVGLPAHETGLSWPIALAILGSIAGILGTYFLYKKNSRYLKRSRPLLYSAFYVDTLYEKVFVSPLSSFSRFITGKIEPVVFEGSVQQIGERAGQTAKLLQKMQSGQIRSYVAWIVIGSIFVLSYLVFLRFSHA